jgi:hypothetical protein
MGTRLILAVLCAVMLSPPAGAGAASDQPNTPAPALAVKASTQPPLFVGLRRSSYGLRKLNTNDLWWTGCAKQFASNLPGSQAQPAAVEQETHEVVGRLQLTEDGLRFGTGENNRDIAVTFGANDAIEFPKFASQYVTVKE